MEHEKINLREVVWIGDSKARLKEFPQPVQKDIGDALFILQAGSMSPAAKPFKGIGSGGFRDTIGLADRYLSCCIYSENWRASLRAALFSKEIEARN